MGKKKGSTKTGSSSDVLGGSSELDAQRPTNIPTSAAIVRGEPEKPKHLLDEIIAIRSQVLQHVAIKNKETIDSAITNLKEDQQIELERLQRRFEKDICSKMKMDVYSQVLGRIKGERALEWSDVIETMVREMVATQLAHHLNDQIQVAIANDKESSKASITDVVASMVDTRVRKTLEVERQKSEAQMEKIIKKQVLGHISPPINEAMSVERKKRHNDIEAVHRSLKEMRVDINSLGKLCDKDGHSISGKPMKSDTSTNKGLEDKITLLQTNMDNSFAEIEKAFSIHVDTVDAVWNKFVSLETAAEFRLWRGTNYLEEGECLETSDDDLITFEDTTTLAHSSKLSSPCRVGTHQMDPFGANEELEGLAEVLDCLKLDGNSKGHVDWSSLSDEQDGAEAMADTKLDSAVLQSTTQATLHEDNIKMRDISGETHIQLPEVGSGD